MPPAQPVKCARPDEPSAVPMNEWGTSAREPVTKNEYFEYSDSRPTAEAQAALAGQVPGFSIRMWLDVTQYTEQQTEALARQVAEGFIPSSLHHARTRPVTLITTYP